MPYQYLNISRNLQSYKQMCTNILTQQWLISDQIEEKIVQL